MVLNRDVLTFDVSGFVEALAKRTNSARIRRPAVDKSDDRHLRLLRSRRQRPRRRRAAEQRHELPVIRRAVFNYLDAQEDRLMEMCTRMSQERYGVY